MRYAEPTGNDYNHVDGIGILHLVQYFYPGDFPGEPSLALGGNDPDFRDAKIRVSVRGNDWRPRETELLWWAQVDVHHGKPSDDVKFSNWAHTGFDLTDALFSGSWQTVEYRLENDTTSWTYAGTNRELNAELQRSVYVYTPLDDALGHLDIDAFHLLAFANPYDPTTGQIDFDELDIVYRNHSLVFPSNGGSLVSAPAGSPDDPAALADGYRNGAGHTWRSAPSPKAPVEIVYAFASPVVVDRVQLHQHPTVPAKDVEVMVSSDDGASWTTMISGTMPERADAGTSFAYLLERDLAATATRMKVRILSGYSDTAWGLGEIEVFGSGARMQTDDDWYNVNADLSGLFPGSVVHYRLVTSTDGVVRFGEDRTFEVPANPKPEVRTDAATRIRDGGALLHARINTLGISGDVVFEFGPDRTYGMKTEPKIAGPEITPRTTVASISGLAPGATIHYRAIVSGPLGTTFGEDATFVAK
ncbi:MAG: hypothetical protein QM702_21610 [Rubrivivax sp.]